MTAPKKIRWLIAHQPQHLFVRTARAFNEELERLMPGQFEVEILTYQDYKDRYGDIEGLAGLDAVDEAGDHNWEKYGTLMTQGMNAFWRAIQDGAFEMSQIQVNRVGEISNDFAALDLPFLFDDHDHVSRVVDGEIGREMLAKLGQESGVRGLAFTYSGGYRVIGSNEPITSLDDLQAFKVVVENDISIQQTLNSLNVPSVVMPSSLWKKFDPINSGKADAMETTYLRFYGKHVLKTNHSVFMTTVLANNHFWNSLTEDQQQAFLSAAQSTAAIERRWSLEDAENFERDAKANGVTIHDMTESDKQKLRKHAQISYVAATTKTKNGVSPELVSRIRRTVH
jgi:TRAP-type C4-dicarboxylate transport system substrate-binding protein